MKNKIVKIGYFMKWICLALRIKTERKKFTKHSSSKIREKNYYKNSKLLVAFSLSYFRKFFSFFMSGQWGGGGLVG